MAQLYHFQMIGSFWNPSKIYLLNTLNQNMSKLSIISNDFVDGGEIPKECGYKHGNEKPHIDFIPGETEPFPWAMIMDDPDAMKAVGKVWVHWLEYGNTDDSVIEGKNDFGEIGYGGPAPPDGRHTYVFKLYELDTDLDLKEGYSKQELEDAIKGHIIAEAKLTGTYAP
jgi:phosphatidylethanolamine-binding protein (PEBP) family uncharacterized protein